MKIKNVYEPPVSQSLAFDSHELICASTTTYAGAVNAFADIDETDISDLWD